MVYRYDDFEIRQVYKTPHFIGIQSYHYSLSTNLNNECLTGREFAG